MIDVTFIIFAALAAVLFFGAYVWLLVALVCVPTRPGERWLPVPGEAWLKRQVDRFLRSPPTPEARRSRVFTADPADETDYREAPSRAVEVREIALTPEQLEGLTLEEPLPPTSGCKGHAPACEPNRAYIRSSPNCIIMSGDRNFINPPLSHEQVLQLARVILGPTDNVVSLAEERQRRQSAKALGRT